MPKKASASEKNEILKESFVEKELLNASLIQRELMGTIEVLNGNLKELNRTLILIREHEFMEFHKSKWKIFAHQILLGMLFAVGTVLGLIVLSWISYNVIKDSAILRGIVDRQLQMRNFNLEEIKDKATRDAGSGYTSTGIPNGGESK
jgi:hypothetical protein